MTEENINGTMPDIPNYGSIEPKSMIELENSHEENFMPEQSTGDEIKLIRPIAMIEDFIKFNSQTIVDMKWVLNDTFLAILTSSRQLLMFDPLLQVYQMAFKSGGFETVPCLQISTGSAKGPSNRPREWRIMGWRNEVNEQGLPVQTNSQCIGIYDRIPTPQNLIDGCD